MQNSKFKIKKLLVSFCIFNFAFLISCRIPNLEAPECIQARTDVKEFYSYHFGNDMKPAAENLRTREKFLSSELLKNLSAGAETKKDYFTQTEDYPKAFRLGECRAVSTGRTDFGILLFWKDDARSEQREIRVEAVKENDKWLIDKVSAAN